MTHENFEKYMMSLPEVWLDFPFGEKLAVYKFGKAKDGEGKIVALVQIGSKPLRVSLKCDPLLAKILRERYETVLPGENLSKKHWNTVICSGQLADDEVLDLARLSYELAIKDVR